MATYHVKQNDGTVSSVEAAMLTFEPGIVWFYSARQAPDSHAQYSTTCPSFGSMAP